MVGGGKDREEMSDLISRSELPERANHPDWCDGGRYDKGYNDCIDELLADKE